ncbi:MAG: glutamate-5-semialdehyde dehydrogenase [Clostridiales bacterium]|nr:glutamate-5-semialdehyde dehydrogenase [Clostridiales bacterium]
MRQTQEILQATKRASAALAQITSDEKNAVLLAMADALQASCDTILAENQKDLQQARGVISDTMLDRLALNKDRVFGMAQGIRDVVALPDPVGRIQKETVLTNGLCIRKVSVPMGVVGVIYESRPNVTSDVAALTLKSSNACVLRGGKEAYRSARAIVDALHQGMKACGLDENVVNLIEDTSRTSAQEMMHADDTLDLLIPRGGAGLIRACVTQATVPCIQTGTGICHVYVDQYADLDKALNIIENAKTSRPSVCNAEEVCLVHAAIAPTFLPRLKARLVDDRIAQGKTPVELRTDVRAHAIIGGTPAGTADFDTEFLDYILAVAVVDDVHAAIDHIAAHSTHHSDAIVTQDKGAQELFCALVDSAAVYVNASTRFTDGGVFGLGCEIGISTQKLHARGPMGLEELTTYKYIVTGDGQIR